MQFLEQLKQKVYPFGSSPLSSYATLISQISSSGGGSGTDISATTAVPSAVLNSYIFYKSNGEQASGTIPTVTATKSANVITVPSGYIATPQTLTVTEAGTATISNNTVTIPVGYIASQREITVGTALAATTYTPTTTDQTISSGKYTTGTQTIKGDANLIASNIVDGVIIFGVEGTAQIGVNTSDANAVPSSIISGKTAYVNGSKITGTLGASTPTTSNNVITIPSGYVATEQTVTVGTALAATSYTPTTTDQTIPIGKYTTGVQTIQGDANLVASNIVSGITIFGVTGTASTGGGNGGNNVVSSERIYPLYMTNGWRENPERLFQADINISGSTITFPTPFRQPTPGSKGLIFNGNLYRHDSSLNNDTWNKSFSISATGDWDFITYNLDGDNLVAVKDGKLARIHASNDSNPFYSGSDPVSIVIPTNSPSGITQLGRGYDCWVCIDENNHPSMFHDSSESTWTLVTNTTASISKILNQYISDWNEGEGFRGCLAIDSNGSIVKVCTSWTDDFTSESELYVETYASAGNDPFLNFYYHYENSYDAPYSCCVNFAIRSSGLWYKVGDGSWNQVSNAPSLLSGNMLGYAFTVLREDGYNEETWEPIYSLDVQKIALHIDTSGRLWKMMANMDQNGSFTGISVTQVGSDTNWTYVNPIYGKNQSFIAQKGGKLYVLKSSNDNNFTFTWTEYYMNPPGKLIMQNQEGLWFASNGQNYTVIYSGGIIEPPQN